MIELGKAKSCGKGDDKGAGREGKGRNLGDSALLCRLLGRGK